MPGCCVYGCSNHSSSNKKDYVTFHIFPDRIRSPLRYKAWRKRVNRTETDFVQIKQPHVCSIHFSPDDYDQSYILKSRMLNTKQRRFLKKSAIPSLYLNGQNPSDDGLNGQKRLDAPQKRNRQDSAYLRKKVVEEAILEYETRACLEFCEVKYRGKSVFQKRKPKKSPAKNAVKHKTRKDSHKQNQRQQEGNKTNDGSNNVETENDSMLWPAAYSVETHVCAILDQEQEAILIYTEPLPPQLADTSYVCGSSEGQVEMPRQEGLTAADTSSACGSTGQEEMLRLEGPIAETSYACGPSEALEEMLIDAETNYAHGPSGDKKEMLIFAEPICAYGPSEDQEKKSKYKGSTANTSCAFGLLHQAVGAFREISNQNKKSNQFQAFVDDVAFQLERLPLEDALVLQSEIQNLITSRRVKVLNDQRYLENEIFSRN